MSCEIDTSTVQAPDQSDQQMLDLPEGVPPLNSLYMYISGSCNLACRHCWITPTYQSEGNGGQHIKVEHVQKAIREAKPLGLGTVKLTGGEPTLHPKFRDIVSLIDDEGLNIQIETNGTLIDENLAQFLRQKKHVSFISVSLDGVDAKTHENLRAVDGSYEQAVTGIRNLVDQGYQPQLICTLYRGNVTQIAQIIELAEDLGCGSVKFNNVQHVGKGDKFAKEQGLTVSEVIDLYHHIEKELRPAVKIRVHFDIPFAFHPIRRLVNDPLSRCNIMNIMGMLAGGELSLCGIGVTIPELIYGQIERDSLSEVWCNSPGLVQLREQIPTRLEGICAGCLHRDLCLGSCVANNFHTVGKLNAPYRFCVSAETQGLFPSSRKKLPRESNH